MKPTEICFRELCREENWRRSEMSVPLPNELVKEAWKASVGYSRESNLTHFAWISDQHWLSHFIRWASA